MFDAIDTPAVLVDLDIAEANIDRFQAYCDTHGIRSRPHIKTHKLPRLALRQIAAGAIGITCQKISEAEAMIAEGGIDDVLITYNIVGAAKLARLRALADRVRLSVVADSGATVEGLSRSFAEAEAPLRVLVECDTGAHRCGVATPEAARDLARAIDASPGLAFGGLMTYPPFGALAQLQDWLAAAKELCEDAGLTVGVVSGGGTPDMWHAHEVPVVTEYRAGTYVYNDRFEVGRSAAGWEDCALTILATVVSVPDPHRAIIDAGSKALTSDLLGLTGHGRVIGREDIVIDQLSEEHGRLVSDAPIGLAVGERLRIIPNHACVVTNLFDAVTAHRGGAVEGPIPVAARGCVR
jgi:D-serine deaminase-like pyridoxal phosphate-dependent protein